MMRLAEKIPTTHLVGACEIHATRLAMVKPSPTINCHIGALFSKIYMVVMLPRQLPTKMAKAISAKWLNSSFFTRLL